jgi:hypothetical protein
MIMRRGARAKTLGRRLTSALAKYEVRETLRLRVKGEGGVSKRGHKKNGKLYRVTLGEYSEISLEAAEHRQCVSRSGKARHQPAECA